MDYLCAYDWQQAEDCVCLVLKQLEFLGKVSVVFGCMSYNRTFVKKMTEWFYERGLAACQRNDGKAEYLERVLGQALQEQREGDSGVVFFCVGNGFVLGRMGQSEDRRKIRVGLLNYRFGRQHYGELLEEGSKQGDLEQEEVKQEGYTRDHVIISGRLEPGVGILAATEEFFQNLSREQITACLDVKALNGEIRLQKRLRELGMEAERKGGKHPAQMLVVTCQNE